MQSVLRILKWAVPVVSASFTAASKFFDFRDLLGLNLSSDRWMGIGLFVFFASVIAILISYQRNANRKSAPQSVDGATGTILHEEETTPTRLEQLALQDLDNLKQRIRVEIREIHFHGLKDKMPHFIIIVSLFNGSVFKIRLSQCIGFIQLGGSHCDPPQLERLPELEHGTGCRVELHQNLNDKTAEWLIEQATGNTTANLVGILCRFVFQVTTEGYNKQIEIPISEGGLNCIPKGIVIVAPNGNACNFMG